ncbi:MAG TPA: SPOR domain-containing protein [Pseudomonadales bacterium]|nr:SPOR domain-containing protein [Pseudomonadales bacterium]
MNERSRNRIVGVIVLVSLAVIFLPMLLDGAGIEQREVPRLPEGAVPQARDLQVLAPEGEDWDFVAEVEARRASPDQGGIDGRGRNVPAAPAPVPAAGDEIVTALAEDGTPLAWSVQLATFADEDNARRLREQLRADGYEAYLNLMTEGERTLFRVAVGPRLDRASVERLQAELQQRYELDGMVVRFALQRPTGQG